MTIESIPWIVIVLLFFVSNAIIYCGIRASQNPLNQEEDGKFEIIIDFESVNRPGEEGGHLLFFGISLLVITLVILGLKLTS